MARIQLVGQINRSGKSKYYWKIPNVSQYSDLDYFNYLVSPVFSTCNSGEGFKWQLKFKIGGHLMTKRRFIWLYIECLSDDDVCTATITVGILKKNNSVLVEQTENYNKGAITSSFSKVADWDFVMDPANEILDDDVLTVCCKIEMRTSYPVLPTVFNTFAVENKSSDKSNNLSHEVKLRLEDFDDFENLLNDGDFGDLKISIEDKSVMAHKCVLAKRSPVFAAMFRSDMRELRNNGVEVKDIKYDIFMEMLRFIYSGKVHRLEEIAMDLLAAADMYQLENLKILCEIELMKQLSVEDALRILKLADKHHVEELKKQAIGYIVENRKYIFDQTAFQGLGHELMYEICRAMK